MSHAHASQTRSETGIASWYGPDHKGRPTANGERFNPQAMTCAHKSLPFHTIVRVLVADQDTAVTCRINDRGPYVRGRVIDLSQRCAHLLGITERGRVPVRLEILHMGSPEERHHKHRT